MTIVDAKFWRGRRVLLTGHTGFKGAWLSLWLTHLGAEVIGFSAGAPTEPSLFKLAKLDGRVHSIEGDVRNFGAVSGAVRDFEPEIVIHMAAQPLVRRSYEDPRETYETNVMGTVNLLEAVRLASRVQVALVITSDKCYENHEWIWGYREDEPMGGHDPYSNSKGCAELVTAAYRRSFFAEKQATRVATARAGNVIGGGDWGADRLLPDIFRGALAGEPIAIRNPNSIRPWQHVLNPLSGYLALVQALWHSPEPPRAFNFGPADEDARPVRWITERITELWGDPIEWHHDVAPQPHEAHYLKLDSALARSVLNWTPTWDLEAGLEHTVAWYRELAARADMTEVTLSQIEAFEAQ